MKSKTIVALILTVIFFIVVDQSIKGIIVQNEVNISLIPGSLEITYVQNSGMAFGIGNANLPYIIVLNLIIIVLIVRFLCNQFEKINNVTKFMLCLILAGGISNLVDRIFRGYVVDYINVRLINFPVFNLADMFIVVGWIMFLLITIRYAIKNKSA